MSAEIAPRLRGSATHAVLAAALTVAAWLVVGLAAALLLAGVIAMTAALRRVTALHSPFVALAAALVVNTATVTALAIAASALPSPGTFSATALCILAIPLIAGLGAWATLRRRARATAPDRQNGAIYFMWAVLGLYILADAGLTLRGSNFGFAWAMSGDATSHISIARSIIFHHGLTPHQIRSYPPVADVVLALVSASAGRHGLSPVALLVHDGRALAAVMVLMTCGVSILLAGCVWHVAEAMGYATSRARTAVYVVMFAAAVAATTEAGMGIGVFGGYLSGVGGVLLELATIVLAIKVMLAPRPTTLVLAFGGAVLTTMTWVVIGIIVTSVVAVAAGRLVVAYRRDEGGSRSRTTQGALICVFGGIGIAAIAVAGAHQSLASSLVQPGGFPHVVPWVLVPFVGTAVLGVLLAVRGPALWVFGIATVIGAATLLTWAGLTAALGPPGLSRYYELKIFWLQAAALLWVPLALILLAVLRYGHTWSRSWLPTLAGVVAAGAVVVSYNHVQVSTSRDFSPLAWIYSGGAFSNEHRLAQVFGLAAYGHPVVFWDGRRGSDSLAVLNLVSVQVFDAAPARGQDIVTDPSYDLPETANAYAFRKWADGRYPKVATGKPVAILCELLRLEAHVIVITDQPSLPAQLASICPGDARNVARLAPAS